MAWGVSFGDRDPLALSWGVCWPLKGLLCPRWSPPPAPPVPRDLAQQTEAPGAAGLPPQHITRCQIALNTCVRVRTRPQTRMHTRTDPRSRETGLSCRLPRPLPSWPRLREKLCCTIQIYFNTLNAG